MASILGGTTFQRRYTSVLLYGLQSPVNIGQILRTGEQFQMRVFIFDPRGIFNDSEKRHVISDFSCGALTRRPPCLIDDYQAFKDNHRGRMVATCLRPDATLLSDFCFQQEDIVVLGNEYDGLPSPIIDTADAALYIPLPKASLPKPPSFAPIDASRNASVAQDGIPNLNVAMTASIIGYVSRMQTSFLS